MRIGFLGSSLNLSSAERVFDRNAANSQEAEAQAWDLSDNGATSRNGKGEMPRAFSSCVERSRRPCRVRLAAQTVRVLYRGIETTATGAVADQQRSLIVLGDNLEVEHYDNLPSNSLSSRLRFVRQVTG